MWWGGVFRAVGKDILGAESSRGPFRDGPIHLPWGLDGGASGGGPVCRLSVLL